MYHSLGFEVSSTCCDLNTCYHNFLEASLWPEGETKTAWGEGGNENTMAVKYKSKKKPGNQSCVSLGKVQV